MAAATTTDGQLSQLVNGIDQSLLQLAAFSDDIKDDIRCAVEQFAEESKSTQEKVDNVTARVQTMSSQMSTVTHRTNLQSMILNNIQGSVSGLDTTLQQIQLDTTGLQGASADLQRISQAISQLSSMVSAIHNRLDHLEMGFVTLQEHLAKN